MMTRQNQFVHTTFAIPRFTVSYLPSLGDRPNCNSQLLHKNNFSNRLAPMVLWRALAVWTHLCSNPGTLKHSNKVWTPASWRSIVLSLMLHGHGTPFQLQDDYQSLTRGKLSPQKLFLEKLSGCLMQSEVVDQLTKSTRNGFPQLVSSIEWSLNRNYPHFYIS